MRSCCGNTWFQIALAAIFMGGATELGMAQWLPAYAETSLGFSPTVAGIGLLLFSIAMALGRMAVGALEGAASAYAVMVWRQRSLGRAFPSRGVSAEPLWASRRASRPVSPAAPCGRRCWLSRPTAIPDGGASMFAALAAFGNAGGILMPWIIGYVGSASGLRLGLAISALRRS